MAKKQSRRSISVAGSTYRRLAVVCEREGRSVSGRLEELIAPPIEGVEDPNPGATYEPKKRKADEAIEDAFPPRFL